MVTNRGWHESCSRSRDQAMRTPLSIQDLAVLMAVLQKPLEKTVIARRALRLVEGATFDEAVAIATVDRLVALGALRKVGPRYEITHEGRSAASQALQGPGGAAGGRGQAGPPRLGRKRALGPGGGWPPGWRSPAPLLGAPPKGPGEQGPPAGGTPPPPTNKPAPPPPQRPGCSRRA